VITVYQFRSIYFLLLFNHVCLSFVFNCAFTKPATMPRCFCQIIRRKQNYPGTLESSFRDISLAATHETTRKFWILKKTLLPASIALLLSILFISCQKEISLEKNANRGGTARYSLEGGTATCTGAVLSGSFTAGVAATSANTVTLAVSVDSIGTYAIATNTINGITFSGSGVFTSTGAQDITLTASGTPSAAGTYDFMPIAGGCSFSITVASNNGGSGGTASYTLGGGTSSCTDASVSGTLTAGSAASAANTVALKVTVNTVGTYSISTNTTNGISFAGSGSFTTTGEQSIILTASGTPTAAGTFAYTPGSNGCSFNVTVKNSGSTPGGGSGSGNFLRCKIDGVLKNFNASLVGYYITPPNAGIPYSISTQGRNSDVAGSIEELWVTVSDAKSPTTGLYKNLTITSNATDRACGVGFYPTGFPNLFWGPGVFNENAVTVNVTTVTANSASGTFQGAISEQNGIGPAIKQVTEGEFKITF
jgi:hypothetical protein